MTALTIHARPTTYITRSGDRIHMRSRLEADFARYLDHCDLTWQYEPDMVALPPRAVPRRLPSSASDRRQSSITR